MKKSLFLVSLAFATQIGAQTTKIYVKGTTTALPADKIFQLASVAEDAVKITIDVENTSANTKKYVVKRYDVLLHTTAVANFCFAGACYGADKFQSPDSLVLAAGKKASELDAVIPNSTLDADLTETATTTGKSIVKYTIMNALSHADSIQFTISYNNAIVGLKEISKNVSAFTLYPNPAKDVAAVKINTGKSAELEISVYNVLGDLVHTEKTQVNAGDNEIKLDVRSFPKGVYFVNVPDGKTVLTKKLVIN